MSNPVEIVNWLKVNAPSSYKFVGVADDGEVFVETSDVNYLGPSAGAFDLAGRLKNELPGISRVTLVVKPSLEQLEAMVRELNKVIDGPPKNLQGIEDF